MKRSTIAAIALLASAAGCLYQAATAYPALPATVASHFGPSGAPNGWAPKGGFMGLYVIIVFFMAATLLAALRSIKNTPDEKLNLPNKEYWLAPERRESTMDTVAAFLLLFGTATNLLLMDIFGQAILFNLGRTSGLDHPVRSLAVYGIFTVVWIAAFVLGFKQKPGPGAQNS